MALNLPFRRLTTRSAPHTWTMKCVDFAGCAKRTLPAPKSPLVPTLRKPWRALAPGLLYSLTLAIERAAEALYEFVFSGCDRLDGKHHWEHCTEETKEGFRREAAAVLEAVWPISLPREIKSSQVGKRQIGAALELSRSGG